MAESLRVHSDFMRVRRRQDAEERAGKAGVKLVFPIFLFILPSIFDCVGYLVSCRKLMRILGAFPWAENEVC